MRRPAMSAPEEEEEEMEEEAVVVGEMATVMVPKHIKKRSLKNKALSISFDEKSLRDFVTGFHKRKKKRRKEAQRQLQEKERLKRIEARKKRKQERELALYGRILSSGNPGGSGSEADDAGRDGEGTEADIAGDLPASVSETKTYDDGSTRITVTTCEISRENDDPAPKHAMPRPISYTEKNRSLAVKKKSPPKKASRSKAHKRGKKDVFSKGKRKKKGNK